MAGNDCCGTDAMFKHFFKHFSLPLLLFTCVRFEGSGADARVVPQ
jgi:hypothetical protein